MAQRPGKIVKTIISYGKLAIKLHLKLTNEKGESVHCEYEYKSNTYLRLDTYAFLTIDIMEHGEWDPSKSIMITPINLPSVISCMKTIIHDIYNEKIFAVKKSGEIVIYSDLADKFTQHVPLLNSQSALVIKPAVVYDENEVSYEGVYMCINKIDNIIDLPIQLFESIVYILERIDLFAYSQLLLNYVASYYGEDDKTSQPTIVPRKRITFDKPQEGKVTSNFKPSNDDDDIFAGL